MPDGQSYSSNANVGVTPSAAGAVLTAGAIPLINTAESTGGTLYLVNAGTQNATIAGGGITYPAGVSGSDTNCETTLAPGAGCQTGFTIQQGAGNGNITINYSGGASSSLTQSLTWYNGTPGALVQMSAAANPLSFSATLGGDTLVTLTNVGGYNLTNVSVTQNTLNGSATASSGAVSCIANGVSTGTDLKIGGSCTYTLSVADAADEAGIINLGMNADYSNNGTAASYSRLYALNYISNPYAALLTFDPNPLSMSIAGNNSQSLSQTLTLKNVGSAPATVSSITPAGVPASMTLSNVDCPASGEDLADGAQCSYTVILGPTTATTTFNGTATLAADYSGGQTSATTSTENINYTINANSQSLSIASVTASGGVSGDGSSSNQFSIPGTVNNATVTVTYKNSGTNPVKITGYTDTNSVVYWDIDSANSSCISSLPSAEIAVDGTCTISYKNVITANMAAVPGLSSSFTENLTLPTLIFQDQVADTPGKLFTQQPQAPAPVNSTTVTTQGNTTTVVNTVEAYTTGSCASKSCILVSNSVTNATGYSDFSVTSQMESYFILPEVSKSANCSVSPQHGNMIQTCSFTAAGGNEEVVYELDKGLYASSILHLLYSNTTTQAINLNSYAATYTLPSSSNVTIAPLTNWQTIMGSAYAFTATITGGSSTVTPTITGLTGSTVSPLSCNLDSSISSSESCVFIVTGGNYSSWSPATIANSTDVNTPSSAYTNNGINLSITATNSVTVNGSASPLAINNISGTVIAPYVYLPAAQPGDTATAGTGITWGTNGAVATRFTVGKDSDGNACTSGQEIELDTLTGLTWVQAPTSTTYTWANANAKQPASGAAIPASYCGYTDWRLPTERELLSLFNYAAISGNQATWLNGQGFSNVQADLYWSSTPGGDGAWYVDMRYGTSGSFNVSFPIYVWPVRGGQ